MAKLKRAAATSPPEAKGPNAAGTAFGLVQSQDEITNQSIAHACGSSAKGAIAWA